MNILEKIKISGLVPVVVLEKAEDAIPTAEALLDGGVDTMEITFRTSACIDAIKSVAGKFPDMIVGAGTVLNLKQCQEAVNSGAKFIVSPGYSEEIVSWCVDNDVVIIPGCITPTEIMAAMSHGLNVVKFFPADVYGGLKTLKSLSGPFTNVKFIPTGGANAKNLKEYISSPYVWAVGGSWMCTKADISNHEFHKITDICKEARAIIRGNV